MTFFAFNVLVTSIQFKTGSVMIEQIGLPVFKSSVAQCTIDFAVSKKLLLVNIRMTFLTIPGQVRKLLYGLIFGSYFKMAVTIGSLNVLTIKYKGNYIVNKSDFIPD
jgi:hypothetical protein